MSLVPYHNSPEEEKRIIEELLSSPAKQPAAKIDKPREKIVKKGKDFVIFGLKLHDLEGNIAREYSQVEICPRTEGSYRRPNQTLFGWTADYMALGKERLPSLPLLYAILEAIHDNSFNPDFLMLYHYLKKACRYTKLVLSTRIDYSADVIWHDWATPEQITLFQYIPGINKSLEKLAENPDWEKPLRALFMAKDVKKIPQVMKTIASYKTTLKVPKWGWFLGYKRGVVSYLYRPEPRIIGDANQGFIDCTNNFDFACDTICIKSKMV